MKDEAVSVERAYEIAIDALEGASLPVVADVLRGEMGRRFPQPGSQLAEYAAATKLINEFRAEWSPWRIERMEMVRDALFSPPPGFAAVMRFITELQFLTREQRDRVVAFINSEVTP